MIDILIAVAILGGLGLGFGLVLAAASKVFYVETDERLEALNECLPGANCGGCGFAGCGGYAEAVLKGEAPIGACASGGTECAKAMAAIMGVEAQEVVRKVAFVRCAGYQTVGEDGKELGAKKKANYEGIRDCLAASRIGGTGPLACQYGCLGFGNCTKVCKYDAIHIENGVAKVDREKCVGCLTCASVCPKGIIVGVEYDKTVTIPCSSQAKGAVTGKSCTQGCIGCTKCVKICPEQALRVENNLAVIDYEKCVSCGLCTTACPKNLIQKVGGQVVVAAE